jgi:hypothetical protein
MLDHTPENTSPPLTAADFAVLGLRFSEARTAVIRKAVRQTVRKLRETESESEMDHDDTAANMADVAVATYRVLDPRRRQRFWERLNLSFGVSFEDESAERKRILPGQLPEVVNQAGSPRQKDNNHFNVSP